MGRSAKTRHLAPLAHGQHPLQAVLLGIHHQAPAGGHGAHQVVELALDGGQVWIGDLLFMCAAFCWSTYSVLSRRYGLQAIPAIIAITCFAFFSFVPAYALLCATGVLTTHLLTAPWREVAFQAAFQGGGSVVISGITFTQMIRYYGPVRSTMITSLVPGLSALGAVWLLGEPLNAYLILGLLLVTGGILFGVQKAVPAPAAPA